MNTPTEKCSHPDCGFFKDGAGTGCRAMRDNACASERATEAGTPATGKKPQRMKWTADNGMEDDPDGVWCRFDVAEAWAEEARREAAVKGFDAGAEWRRVNYPEGQRPAGGEAVTALKGIRDVAYFDSSTSGDVYYRKAENALAAIECRDAVPKPQPVAEAAAQADGCTLTEDLGCANPNCTGTGLCYVLEMQRAAAPTAQPTPPDDELRQALAGLLKRYGELAGSGDAGHWDWEAEDVVIAARAALRHPPVTNVGDLRLPQVEVAGSTLEADTGARLRLICRMLGITELPDTDQGVYEVAFAVLGMVRRELEKRLAPATQPTQAGVDPAAAATIELPESGVYVASSDGVARDSITDRVYEGDELFTPEQLRAAIAAAREEGARTAKLTDEMLEKQVADLRARLASAGAERYELIATVVRKNTVVWEAADPIDIHELEEGTKVYVLRAARQDSAAADKGGT